MTRTTPIKVITANALLEGDVVWLSHDGNWTRHLADALPFSDPEQADAALQQASQRHDEVVGCYLADMRLGASGLEPTHFREDFRRRGPSNYAHGKQSQG
ncbi:DUF2849 domain-containing protein [Roseinatronobacter alkalisoli]|uniref:DUF2849 domain-containing protein n=1 Tax=Roseinatronobacter alkalisoli TaxID=3028235 RepID=A0ABT5T9F0_9RHOB|nr:DUF2849 domain-containing protein [Roseinatronobacter sp. HJB301]MDD7970548.1 DUF2849 domain-containing protein [Roseinatronobacter sp. HJB301]